MPNDVKTLSPETGLAADISISDLGRLVAGEEITAPAAPAAEPAKPAPEPSKPAEPAAPAAAAVETPAAEPEKKIEGEEHTPEPKQEPEKPEKKSWVDERLSKLARKRREAEEALAAERRETERLRGELAAKSQPGPTPPVGEPEAEKKPPETKSADPEPDLKTFVAQMKEGEEYEDAVARFVREHRQWEKRQDALEAQQKAQAETEKTQRETFLKDWEQALEAHPDFEDVVERVRSVAPEGLQLAISQLREDDGKAIWPAVTMYLGEHPEELAALSRKFAVNQFAAVAALGRIAAGIASGKQAPQPAQAPPKTAPAPPAVVGGHSTPAPVDFEKADINTCCREFSRLGL